MPHAATCEGPAPLESWCAAGWLLQEPAVADKVVRVGGGGAGGGAPSPNTHCSRLVPWSDDDPSHPTSPHPRHPPTHLHHKARPLGPSALLRHVNHDLHMVQLACRRAAQHSTARLYASSATARRRCALQVGAGLLLHAYRCLGSEQGLSCQPHTPNMCTPELTHQHTHTLMCLACGCVVCCKPMQSNCETHS